MIQSQSKHVHFSWHSARTSTPHLVNEIGGSLLCLKLDSPHTHHTLWWITWLWHAVVLFWMLWIWLGNETMQKWLEVRKWQAPPVTARLPSPLPFNVANIEHKQYQMIQWKPNGQIKYDQIICMEEVWRKENWSIAVPWCYAFPFTAAAASSKAFLTASTALLASRAWSGSEGKRMDRMSPSLMRRNESPTDRSGVQKAIIRKSGFVLYIIYILCIYEDS